MPVVTFKVDGIPKGQPRPRAFARNGHAGVYDPGTANDWKTALVAASLPSRPASPIVGPVRVNASFLLPRPKRLCRKCDPASPMPCESKPDIDNLAKSALDALTSAGWWRDDAQVEQMIMGKLYHAKDGRPGAIVTVIWGEEV